MFGIDDVLLFSALGGGLGALTSKKPMQGALMGAGLGAAGGAFLPGLLGGATATGATTAGLAGVPASVIPEGIAFNPATASEMAGMGASAGAPGLFGQAMQYVKPIGQAAGAANAVGGLLSNHQQPITPSPMMAPTVGGNQVLGQLAQGGGENLQQMQLAEQMRQKRRMGLLGGGNGLA